MAAAFSFTPLTPTSFLQRAARVYRNRIAVVDGEQRYTYEELFDRCCRLGGALRELGVEAGERVAAFCTNSHVMLELHCGVPFAGAVIVPLNVRLSPAELAGILRHCSARVIVATPDLADTAAALGAKLGITTVIAGPGREYEARIAAATPWVDRPGDERDLLAINYTSGTSGRPKGVMYHHRGAYLQALAMAFHSGFGPSSTYLWTLPMFHCDGWCFPWAVTAAGARHLCIPKVDVDVVWDMLRTKGVTHFSAAPTVLTMIAGAPGAAEGALGEPVHAQTGGAPPSPALLARLAGLNISVTHLYGLTETFGPLAINDWHPEWDSLPEPEQAALRARQGVGNVVAQPLRVVDDAGRDVPADAATLGEIVCRGNNLMSGYYQDDEATAAVNLDGWFRTGDLGVMHSDRYIELRDRRTDVIISGGENIASVEVERCLDSHPAVLESALVGRPDRLWGEVPIACVTLRPGMSVSPDVLIEYVRSHIAPYKAPREVIFMQLPKTSTGKIQKGVLRATLRASAGGAATDSEP